MAIRRRNLPLLLTQAREAVISNFRPLLNHLGVTEQQWRIVRHLTEAGEMEPAQISKQCQILKPSLSGVLGRMEEMGLIVRCKHESDMRRQQVRLTPLAEKMVSDAAPQVEERYLALEQSLGKELVTDLYRVLDQVIERASRVDDEAGAADTDRSVATPAIKERHSRRVSRLKL